MQRFFNSVVRLCQEMRAGGARMKERRVSGGQAAGRAAGARGCDGVASRTDILCDWMVGSVSFDVRSNGCSDHPHRKFGGEENTHAISARNTLLRAENA